MNAQTPDDEFIFAHEPPARQVHRALNLLMCHIFNLSDSTDITLFDYNDNGVVAKLPAYARWTDTYREGYLVLNTNNNQFAEKITSVLRDAHLPITIEVDDDGRARLFLAKADIEAAAQLSKPDPSALIKNGRVDKGVLANKAASVRSSLIMSVHPDVTRHMSILNKLSIMLHHKFGVEITWDFVEHQGKSTIRARGLTPESTAEIENLFSQTGRIDLEDETEVNLRGLQTSLNHPGIPPEYRRQAVEEAKTRTQDPTKTLLIILHQRLLAQATKEFIPPELKIAPEAARIVGGIIEGIHKTTALHFAANGSEGTLRDRRDAFNTKAFDALDKLVGPQTPALGKARRHVTDRKTSNIAPTRTDKNDPFAFLKRLVDLANGVRSPRQPK